MKTPADRFPALDLARRTADAYGNHAIDEFRAGRHHAPRTAARYASVIGLSLVGGGVLERRPRIGTGQREAPGAPSNQSDSRCASDACRRRRSAHGRRIAASLALLNRTGEFLIDDDGEKLVLKPALALSWKPNDKGECGPSSCART